MSGPGAQEGWVFKKFDWNLARHGDFQHERHPGDVAPIGATIELRGPGEHARDCFWGGSYDDYLDDDGAGDSHLHQGGSTERNAGRGLLCHPRNGT